jgi:hypothetical protein
MRSTAILGISTGTLAHGDLEQAAAALMTTGGDRRIMLGDRGVNQYMVAPRPSDVLAYSSSTANDISPAAFAEVQRRLVQLAPDHRLSPGAYADALEALRGRIRGAWSLPADTDVIFAASGTDLEYIGLAIADRGGGIDNILLGADEVGSGCAHSASGHYFAVQTALGLDARPGEPIDPGTPDRVRLISVPVRGAGGNPIPSEDMLLEIGLTVERAIASGRHPLIHVVHGSKSGLILPSMAHIDALRRRFGTRLSFVVDACQCRLGRSAIAAYLARGATVFVTGSKFMGGPPFSGIALVPGSHHGDRGALLPGFERIFNRAEWPRDWPDAAYLPAGSNLGLLLRLEASIYELELFQKLTAADVRRTLDLFDEAVDMLTRHVRASRVTPYATGQWDDARVHPLEMRTLVTLDLSQTDEPADFEDALAIHKMLFEDLGGHFDDPEDKAIASCRIRLGQPVKCVPRPSGGYGGTLRLGLSMPQMVEFAAMDSASLRNRLHQDMQTIARKFDLIADLRTDRAPLAKPMSRTA